MYKILNNLSCIIDKYDLFIVDIWGVVHNDGSHTFEGVVELLSKIKSLNKKLVFLSNAPHRKSAIENTLSKIGISRDLYTDIHSSGEETRMLLMDPDWKYGYKCFVIGSDNNLLADSDFIKTQDMNEADFILGTSFLNNANGDAERHDLSLYDEIIHNALKRDLLLLCPNPDIIVRTIIGELYCPGAIAKRYEEKGGRVLYKGKPFNSVYERILNWFNNEIPLNKIIAIGDGINTDIKGANNFGIDSVLIVKSGIHMHELWNYDTNEIDPDKLNSFFTKHNITPKFVTPLFK